MAASDVLEEPQNGYIPERRLRNADQARGILDTMLTQDLISSQGRAFVQGLIDGNAPFNQEDLIDAGQADRANVNWGEAEARIDQSSSLFYDLVFSSMPYCSVETTYGRREKRSEYNGIIADEITTMLNRWRGFRDRIEFSQRQMRTFGIGPMVFTHPLSWRFSSLKRRCVLVPLGTPSSDDAMDLVYVRDRMYLDELWQNVANEEMAKRTGWNKSAVIDAMDNCAIDVGNETQRQTTYEWYQEQLKDNSFWLRYGGTTKVVEVCHAFIKEFSGKWTHIIFAENAGGPDGEQFLYEKQDKYNELTDAVVLMFDGVGNGDFHGVRGEGTKVAKYAQLDNRINNALADGVITNSAVLWQAADQETVDKLNLIDLGPHKIIPPGVEMRQFSQGQNLDAAMRVAQFFKGNEASQLGISPSRMPASKTRKTAKQVEYEESDKAQLGGSQAEHYLGQMDVVYWNVVTRACNPNLVESDPDAKPALEFQRRCLRRGVPRAALLAIQTVKATRAIGMGSPSTRMFQLGQLEKFIPYMPPLKQAVYVRASIAAICQNQDAADKYGPDLDGDLQPDKEAAFAAMENNAFVNGGEVIFYPDAEHVVHLQIHFQFTDGVIQKLQVGAIDPTHASMILDAAGPNMSQHVSYLEDDPTRKQQYLQFAGRLGEFMRIADKVRAAARSQASQQQKQLSAPQGSPGADQGANGPSPDPATAKVQAEIAIMQQKAQTEIEIKQAKAKQALMIKDAQAAQKINQGARNGS